jgi:UDP-N-acetylenolpyruvoylglucosamine reductase
MNQLAALFSQALTDTDLTPYHNFSKKAGNCPLVVSTQNLKTGQEKLCTELTRIHQEEGLPVRVIGRHSNLFITSEGFSGPLVIWDKPLVRWPELQLVDNLLTVTEPVLLQTIVTGAAPLGFDLSFLAGIPGTVFSAIYNNSGTNTTGRSIAELVQEVYCYDIHTGTKKTFTQAEMEFQTRTSILKQQNLPSTRYIILKAVLKLPYSGQAEAAANLAAAQAHRVKVNKEGYSYKTAGSFWSNGHALAATGKKVRELLQEVDLLDYSFNGVAYTPNYGFLYTAETSTDRDVALFTRKSYETIQNSYKLKLHSEVEILSKSGIISLEQFWEENA